MEAPDLSPNELRLDLILADFAKVSDGKLDIMGGGWSNCVGPHVGPCAVAILAKVPSSWSGQELVLKLELYDEDGALVAHAPQLELRTVTQPGPRTGDPVDLPFAVNIAPFMVVPSRRYQWRITVNGLTSPEWQTTFFVGDGTPPQGILRRAS